MGVNMGELMTKPVILYTDRSAAETDDACGRRLWFNRIAEGGGIVPVEAQRALLIGAQTHEDLRWVAQWSEDAIVLESYVNLLAGGVMTQEGVTQQEKELLFRRLGWLVAFALFLEPKIRERYEDVAVEKEGILLRTPLHVSYTPDRLLRNRKTGKLEYREYKTTISASNKWLASWPFSIQLHIGLAGIEEERGEAPAFAQIMGLMKGYDNPKDGRLMHPYVWAWHNQNLGKWTHDYDQARGAGWAPMPVWEYPGGIIEWVKACGEEVALAQFPHTAPVFLNRPLLDEWIARRAWREEQILDTKDACVENEHLRSLMFPRILSKCRPGFGDPCPYLLPCMNAAIGRDPLGSGLYTKRTPHHASEVLFREEDLL